MFSYVLFFCFVFVFLVSMTIFSAATPYTGPALAGSL